MNVRRSIFVPLLGLALVACSSMATPSPAATAVPSVAPTVAGSATPTAAPTAPPASLTIYGAASLTAVLAKVKQVYEAANPGTTITSSTDSSAALETKIEQGAPADVFLSADTTNPQKLVDGDFASGTVVNFAGNLLTVIVPTANPAGIKTPADLAKSGVKIITCADNVPIARYASQLVTNLARQPGYPTTFVAAYTANVVSKEANVSAVVTKVGLGEGDAGIVYVTDALTSTTVATVSVPDAANVPATYGAVVVKASKNQAAASAFLGWLSGAGGLSILKGFGFLAPALIG